MQTTTVPTSTTQNISLTPDQLPADKLQSSIALVVSQLTGRSVDTAAATRLILSEDLLYASIVHQRLEDRFPGTGPRYLESIGTEYARNVKSEKRQPLSKAVDAFLNGMVTRKQISASNRDTLVRYAFGKSQLDERKSTLARTPENPTTRQPLINGQTQLQPVLARVVQNDVATKKSVESFQERISNNPKLTSAQVRQQADILTRIFPKAAEVPAAQIPTAPPTPAAPSETDKPGAIPDPRKIVTGPDDFAYKPESELDGNMVVMIPRRYRERAVSASIYALDGERQLLKMQSPRYGDDQRPYFRGDRKGTELEGGAIVRVDLVDGSKLEFNISDLRTFSTLSY